MRREGGDDAWRHYELGPRIGRLRLVGWHDGLAGVIPIKHDQQDICDAHTAARWLATAYRAMFELQLAALEARSGRTLQ